MSYYQKYLKYKNKYLNLKKMIGGETELVKAIEEKNIDKILGILKKNPELAKVKNVLEGMPLYIAIDNDLPIEIIDALLDACPNATKEINLRVLPIHLALVKNASFDVVKSLLKAYPEGAKVKGLNELLPIHFALKYKASYEIIEELLIVYPEGAKEFTLDRMLPIHYALYYKAPYKVIQKLLEVYPGGIHIKDSNGLLPMQIANSHGVSPRIIGLLSLYEIGTSSS